MTVCLARRAFSTLAFSDARRFAWSSCSTATCCVKIGDMCDENIGCSGVADIVDGRVCCEAGGRRYGKEKVFVDDDETIAESGGGEAKSWHAVSLLTRCGGLKQPPASMQCFLHNWRRQSFRIRCDLHPRVRHSLRKAAATDTVVVIWGCVAF